MIQHIITTESQQKYKRFQNIYASETCYYQKKVITLTNPKNTSILIILINMNHLKLIAIFVFTIFSISINAEVINDNEIARLLIELDEVIDEGDKYQHIRALQADSLVKLAARRKGSERINLYKEAYAIHSRLQCDSAVNTLRRLSSVPEADSDDNLRHYLAISNGEIMGIMGLYNDAEQLLKNINSASLSHENRLFYYQTLRSVYGWMADFAHETPSYGKYVTLTNTFRDSIIATETDKIAHDIALADKLIVNNEPDEAIKLLLDNLADSQHEERIYLYFNLAEAYRILGDTKSQTYYLILTSISDLRSGVTEYLALPTLANILYKNGDIDRAYKYLIRSMDDANFCEAKLRTMEVSNIFPIIDKAYKQKELENRKGVLFFTAILVALVLVLLAGLFFMLKQNKKLSLTRQKLADANNDLTRVNDELNAANKNLIKTDRIKEEYIARFLERCRSYLDALENYRHSLLKLAKNNQLDALMRQLKDHTHVSDEQQRFYQDFDKAFLDIHPNFVENFNNLLKEEERVYPKSDCSLTTEMRIFALIRLGINDSNKIAHFLNYSLATIYNYRSRITNKSIHDKETFAALLMEC